MTVDSPAVTAQDSRMKLLIPQGVLAFMMFATGAAGLVYEYILMTVVVYLEGSLIIQTSITTGIMIIMMGVGGVLQKRIKSTLVETFVIAELVLVFLGGFSPIILQGMFATFGAYYPLGKVAFVCLMGLLVGFEIPLVTRINERFASDLKNNIATIWSADYFGAGLGLAFWLWLLFIHRPIIEISFYVAAINLVVVVTAIIFFAKKGMFVWKIAVPLTSLSVIVVMIVTAVGFVQGDSISKMLNQRLYDDPIVYDQRSAYQQVTLTERPDRDAPNGMNVELYLNGNKQFSSKDENIYHGLLVHPAMNTAARREHVLILGGGDGMALREVLKYPDVKDVTLVDLDPAVIELARTDPRLIALNDNAYADARVHATISDAVKPTGEQRAVHIQSNRIDKEACGELELKTVKCDIYQTKNVGSVDVFTVDADKFVSQVNGPWDVVIVDLPDPNAIELAKLYSLEFYSKIKQDLAPDGIVVVQSTSPYHAKETFLCILRTMEAAGLTTLPYHYNVPSFGDWGWIMAAPRLNAGELRHKAEALPAFPVDTAEITSDVFKSAMVFTATALESDRTEVSTIMNPVIMQYYTYEAWRTD